MEIVTLENMNIIEDVYRDAVSPDDFVIYGQWVGTDKSPGVHRARWFWRGFEEKVEESDLIASTSMVTSTRLLLAAAAARISKGAGILHGSRRGCVLQCIC